MNLKELEKVIFGPSSDLMRGLGKDVFKNNLVTNIRGKRIENIYHIYGDVLNEIKAKAFKTHIKIDVLNKKVTYVKCSCEQFEDFSRNKKMFMCKHITATLYKFLDLSQKKQQPKNKIKNQKRQYNKYSGDLKAKDSNSAKDGVNKKHTINAKDIVNTNNNEKVKRDFNINSKDDLKPYKEEKRNVEFDIKIIYKSWNSAEEYEVEFRIGENYKCLINNLKSFVGDFDSRKNIFFNSRFIYNPREYRISYKDRKIIDFIREHIHKSKNSDLIKDRLKINERDLRRFLDCIKNKTIQFKYNGIEYKSKVLKSNLPLSFTLKDGKDTIIVTTPKKMPLPLTKNKDVYFWDRQIYLPAYNQLNKYNSLHDEFIKKREILYNKDSENYNDIMCLLNDISDNVVVAEGLRRFSDNIAKLEFHIYKDNDEIYCSVYEIYLGNKNNIFNNNKMKSNKFSQEISREERLLMKIENYKFIRSNNKLKFIGNEEDLFNLLGNKEESLNSLGNVTFGKGFEQIKVYTSQIIDGNMYEENGEIKFSYKFDYIQDGELKDIFNSYKNSEKFYKTRKGSFLDLQDGGFIRFFNLMDMLNIDDIETKDISLDNSKALYVAESLKNTRFDVKYGLDLLNDLEEKIKDKQDKYFKIPKNLKKVLRDYQVNGFNWFKTLNSLGFGGILGDEMGLGKTIQTIAFISSEINIKSSKKHKKVIIIVPTSLIYNWKEEFEKFSPNLRIGISHGSKSKQENILENLIDYDVVLTTYGTLRNNVDIYKEVEFDYCIIDEAQNIKNPKAKITEAIKEIKAKTRFALTGTPIENNLTELWSIFDFVMPGYLYSKDVFEKKFTSNNDDDLENIRLLIKPFILRRTKQEVIDDLPDKIEKKILVDMTPLQKSIYNSYIKEVRQKIKNNSGGKIEIFSYLMRLRQICLDPSIIWEDYEGESGKIKVAMDLVDKEMNSNGKILLFSQFTSVLGNISKRLKEKGIEYFYLDGSVPSKERIKLVNEFNENDNVKIFLISLKAGGTGLNLTSANLVIHFDPWWNPAVEDQATDRAHRIGQKNTVEVIKLVAKGTIEEKIISLQESKKELIESIITGELKNSNTFNKLSKEELVQILKR